MIRFLVTHENYSLSDVNSMTLRQLLLFSRVGIEERRREAERQKRR